MSDEYIIEGEKQPRTTFYTEEEAIDFVLDKYPDAVFGDDWDKAGPHRMRRLFWKNEEDSKGPHGMGDDGIQALGEIVRIISA